MESKKLTPTEEERIKDHGWYVKNRSRILLMRKEYHLKNAEKIRELVRLWRKENPEKLFLYRKVHRANKRTVLGSLRFQTVQAVFEDNIKKYGTLTCVLCLKRVDFFQASIEHLTPIGRGGSNSYDNLGVSHLDCNRKKNLKTMEELQPCRYDY